MFTGIIESVGTIAAIGPLSGGKRMRVHVGSWAGECKPGSSVSVGGVCLTVASGDGEYLEFDVITETLARSTLGAKRIGGKVNLERALRVGDRLDGHFVQGHVDGTAVVGRVLCSPREQVIWFEPQAHLLPYIIPKGSVAVEGVSLTVAATRGPTFSVALIPTTLERTTLSSLSAGDRVNIESDMIVRTIVGHLSGMPASTGVTVDTLRESGFA